MSILDYVKPTLAPSVWEEDEKGIVLRPEIEKQILDTLESAFKKLGSEMDDFVASVYIIGGITSRQWTDESDIDVTVVVRKDMSDKAYGAIREYVVNNLNGKQAADTQHPVNYYFKKEHKFVPDVAQAIYDIKERRWLYKDERGEEFDPEAKYQDKLVAAEEMAEDVVSLVEALKRDLIDLGELKQAKKDSEFYAVVYSEKLGEVWADVENLERIYAQIHLEREKAFAEDPKGANESTANIIYKYLEKYGYLDELKDVLAGQDKFLKGLGGVVGLDLKEVLEPKPRIEEDLSSSLSLFWFDPNGKLYEVEVEATHEAWADKYQNNSSGGLLALGWVRVGRWSHRMYAESAHPYTRREAERLLKLFDTLVGRFRTISLEVIVPGHRATPVMNKEFNGIVEFEKWIHTLTESIEEVAGQDNLVSIGQGYEVPLVLMKRYISLIDSQRKGDAFALDKHRGNLHDQLVVEAMTIKHGDQKFFEMVKGRSVFASKKWEDIYNLVTRLIADYAEEHFKHQVTEARSSGKVFKFADLPEDMRILIGDMVGLGNEELAGMSFPLREIPIDRFPNIPEQYAGDTRRQSDYAGVSFEEFPPIILWDDYWLDGAHRVREAVRRKTKSVPAIDIGSVFGKMGNVEYNPSASSIGKLTETWDNRSWRGVLAEEPPIRERQLEYHGTTPEKAKSILSSGKFRVGQGLKGVSTTIDYREALDYAEGNPDGVLVVEIRPGAEMVGEPGVDFLTGTGSWRPEDIKPLGLAKAMGLDEADNKVTSSPAFKAWFGKSKVVDGKGNPLVVYRGEHGKTKKQFQTHLGSLSFGTAKSASVYAVDPNQAGDEPHAPRVSAVYLRIEKPIVDTDDPFIDLATIEKLLGPQEARRIAVKFAADIENTNNWQDEINGEGQYESVLDFINKNPKELGKLYFDIYLLLDDPKEVAKLKREYFDGAIYGGSGETFDEKEYRVFDIKQVKSAIGNKGTFDPNSSDINEGGNEPGEIFGDIDKDPDATPFAFTVYSEAKQALEKIRKLGHKSAVIIRVAADFPVWHIQRESGDTPYYLCEPVTVTHPTTMKQTRRFSFMDGGDINEGDAQDSGVIQKVNVREKIYHQSSAVQRGKILAQGLIPRKGSHLLRGKDYDPAIYFYNLPLDSVLRDWMHTSNFDLWEIDTKGLKTKFYYDGNYDEAFAIMSYEPIPAKNTKLIYKSGQMVEHLVEAAGPKVTSFDLSDAQIKELAVKFGQGFNGPDDAEQYLRALLTIKFPFGYKDIPNQFKLYRVVWAKSAAKVNKKKVGTHYTMNLKDIDGIIKQLWGEHDSESESPFVLTVKASREDIDIPETIYNNLLYPYEYEITLKEKAMPEVVKVTPSNITEAKDETKGLLRIAKSKNADTRSCDYANVSIEELEKSSKQHIADVVLAMEYFAKLLQDAAKEHDADKLTGIKHFHSDFIGGFKETGWLENHYKEVRHHLSRKSGRVPEDVNFIDVLEYIADNVMAGMGRSGEVRKMDIAPEDLQLAFDNTVKMLTGQVVVSDTLPELKEEDVKDKLREMLADYAHKAWAGWIKYQFGKCTRNEDGSLVVPAESVARWERQVDTPYEELPEKEQTSDRAEADKMIALFKRHKAASMTEAGEPQSGITPEMKSFYEQRTKRHISLVQKYCKLLASSDLEKLGGLVGRGNAHDQSKYKSPELEPYIHLTWHYKLKGEGGKYEYPAGVKEQVNAAVQHHYKNNSHHPQYHSSPSQMSDLDVAEMVADWAAMSEEKGNSLKGWADAHVGSEWKFTPEQVELIYKLIALAG